jgi:hypothetical protein
MKKAIGMLAVLAFVASAANAELLKNFKYDGEVDVNAYNINNADFNKKMDDKTGNVDTRVMLNMGFDLNEDVSAVVSAVKNNRQYGTASESMGDKTFTGSGILDNVFFEQAYLNLKGVIGIDHKIGRQYYGNAGDMVIYFGPNTMPYTSKFAPRIAAIDGWTGWYKNGNWDVNAIIAKETQVIAIPSRDTNLSGVNVKTSVKDVNLNAYIYSQNNKSTGLSDYLDVAGIRANYAIPQVKSLNVAAEYDMNMGKNDTVAGAGAKHNGYAYKANVDYSMDLKGKLGIAGEYYFASGNANANKAFQPICNDYRPGIIMGGGFGIVPTAGAGFASYNVGANWTPDMLNKLNIAVKYYDFSNDKLALAKKHLGSEGDLVATWTHSANVSVNGYYAMFMPEKKIVATNDAETMLGANFNVKF